jgi:myo-inositol-1(or 4)-monophosphatase
MNLATHQRLLEEVTREAGSILLRYFGRVRKVRLKDNASVVCEADLASEQYIIRRLRKMFPQHGIISEEAGTDVSESEFTWVIDPLDGTSNFVAGIPWFGVQIGLLYQGRPVLAAMFLPTAEVLYSAVRGKGTRRNGKRLKPRIHTRLAHALIAFGMDPECAVNDAGRTAALYLAVAAQSRNLRGTNSLVDFCYTLEGHFGGAINLNTKIWDIVPVSLILPEAGGVFSGLDGKKIAFDLSQAAGERTYEILAAAKPLHRDLVRVVAHQVLRKTLPS